MQNKLTLGILITTMNNGIERVKKDLLPQLRNIDEIIISHQITDKNIKPKDEKDLQDKYGKHIKYVFMYDKGLSKNRNNALENSTTDICHICDDDLDYIKGFEKTIKDAYENSNYDVITFQAIDEKGNLYYPIKGGNHNKITVGRVSSMGITFKRKSILEKNIKFDKNFGLGAKYPVGEENIFLKDCLDSGLKLYHCDKPIVLHSKESSGIDYKNRKDLVIARIKVFKRMYGVLGGILAIPYFTILHYKFYKGNISVLKFFILSFESLINIK